MIDHTTLPIIPAYAQVTAGQQFSIRGRGFDIWPTEIVLGYSLNNLPTTTDGADMMKMVSKTNTELIFEATVTHSYAYAHTWNVFASPLLPPRSVLSYVEE